MPQTVECPRCGQKNRVPDLGSGKLAVCGKCHTALPPPAASHPVELSDGGFDEFLKSGKPAVVDFWAAWCGPCRTMAPIFESVAASRSDVAFGKLDTDRNPLISSRYKVSSIPTLIFFRDGVEKGRLLGVRMAGEIEGAIRQFLTA
jgi:thioredoxin 2